MPYTRPVKFKAAHGFKGPYDFEQVKVVQDLSGEHMVSCRPVAWLEGLRMQSFSAGLINQDCRSGQGAVWTMKFSHCGRLLASAGQDNLVRIWVLKAAFDYFNNMRMKYNSEGTSSFWAWSRKWAVLQGSPLQLLSSLALQAASPPPRLRRV